MKRALPKPLGWRPSDTARPIDWCQPERFSRGGHPMTVHITNDPAYSTPLPPIRAKRGGVTYPKPSPEPVTHLTSDSLKNLRDLIAKVLTEHPEVGWRITSRQEETDTGVRLVHDAVTDPTIPAGTAAVGDARYQFRSPE